ncbi:TrkH family potassium uptake protein [Nodosilinea sp. P-1105]|uniref:TrkH family potassium uptake protein n=1 Tax=Nodosilinea sp. P-1105 TaxID=2546229 RepID=UPI00146C92F0|nr:TrkH family potassium uptake protein [Nodosilinea sp. P-1105]NMF83377.1 TrkH family potassium uptake protein [Nodosilinea sp. P-1105]
MGRYQTFLRQRYRAIAAYTGLVCLIAGVGILSPLLALLAYPEEWTLAMGFLLPGGLLIGLGGAAWQGLRPRNGASLTLQEGSVIVVMAWILAILAGTVPFLRISGLSFTQALFESTSGWTTTGLSVVDVTQAPRLILLFRSVTELLGGAGLAIITLSAIAGPSGSGLSSAEGRSEQLAPNVRRSAKLVLKIYLGYIALGILALVLAGMGWFDAVNHAFAALSTGGFSTQDESIGHWDSALIEAVTLVLMLLGSLSFVTSYFTLTGRFQSLWRDGQVRLQTVLIGISTLVLLTIVALPIYSGLDKAIRVALFETVSALTTTGFSTVGYDDWGSLGWGMMILLMLVGGGAGSTAGGIKQLRIYMLYRSLLWEVQQMLKPDRVVGEPSLWQSDRRQFLKDTQVRQVAVFMFLYLATFSLFTLIMSAHGYALDKSLFETASSIGTVGLSVGVTAPDAPVTLLWTQIAAMFLGRLEFFTVFVGLTRMLRDMGPVLSRK